MLYPAYAGGKGKDQGGKGKDHGGKGKRAKRGNSDYAAAPPNKKTSAPDAVCYPKPIARTVHSLGCLHQIAKILRP